MDDPEEDKLKVLEGGGQPPELNELPHGQEPEQFFNPLPGIPTMAAPPAGAFRVPRPNLSSKPWGKYKTVEDYNAAREIYNQSKRPLGADTGRPSVLQQWNGKDIATLRDSVLSGASSSDLMKLFPGRSASSIRNQASRLFGGLRKGQSQAQADEELMRQVREKYGIEQKVSPSRKKTQAEKDEELMQEWRRRLMQDKQSLNQIHPSIWEMVDGPEAA